MTPATGITKRTFFDRKPSINRYSPYANSETTYRDRNVAQKHDAIPPPSSHTTNSGGAKKTHCRDCSRYFIMNPRHKPQKYVWRMCCLSVLRG